MRQLFGIVQLLLAIGLMALLGQGMLYVLAGARRSSNLFYQLLAVVTSPWVKLFRLLTPKFIEDRMVPVAAFAGMSAAFLWLMLWIPTLPA